MIFPCTVPKHTLVCVSAVTMCLHAELLWEGSLGGYECKTCDS